MRVLCVTPMYPEPSNPVFGSFVERLNRSLERYCGVEVTVARRPDGMRGPASYAALLAAAMGARGPFDVIHGHYLGAAASVAVAAKARFRSPLVLTAHGSDIESAARLGPRLALRQVLRTCDAIHFVSRPLQSRAEDLLGRLPARRLVQPTGVELTLFADNGAAPAARVRPALLAVGHLVDYKGWAEIVEAVGELRRRGHDCDLLAVGDGDRGWLRELAADHGVLDRVQIAGAVHPERLPETYGRADLVLIGSHREGFGLVGLEAMAAGVPVVATGVGGMLDYLADSDNALVVPARNAMAMADAAQRVLEDDDLRAKLVQGGRDTVPAFSAQRAAEAVAELYRKLV